MKPPKHNRQKDILFILISSFILVVAWIGFNLWHIYKTSTISNDLQLKLTPISGTFDMATIEKLKTRQQLAPSYERAASDVKPTPQTQPASPAAGLQAIPSQTPTGSPITILGQ